MRNPHTNNFRYFIIFVVSFFILGGQPVKFGQEKTFFHGYLIEKPVIRVGLGVNLGDIKISSSSGMKIYEINSYYKLIAEDVDEALIKGRKEKLLEKFLIQVDQFKDREEAEVFAQDLRTKIEQKVYVVREAEEGIIETFQVRVGDFLTRGDALRYIVKLNQLGFNDTWILEEAIAEDESRPLWILVNDELKSLHDETVLYFVPCSTQSYLSFNGRDYRGLFVLETTRKGIVLVNILNIKDYLKAVVPSELSPYSFRQVEAHKAQAVAARTYAFKNLGANEDLGFDLCDTPNSQFYKGMNAEHPLSSDAVEQTKGEVALHRGKLINALYTSTCGGMTENVENIFVGPALPYLRATECVYEKQKEWNLRTSNIPLPIYVESKNIAPAVASLISLGVIPKQTDPLYYREAATFEEVLAWINNARVLLGKKGQGPDIEPAEMNYRSFARMLIQGFGWQERVKNLLLSSETDFILKDNQDTDEKTKGSIAYLVQTGIFPVPDQAVLLNKALKKGEIILCLWRAIQTYEGMFSEGTFEGLNGQTAVLGTEKGKEEVRLTPDFFLIRNYDGEPAFTSQVYLLGGEQVRWIDNDKELKHFEVIYPPHSNILDRDSAFHSWQLKRSKQDLERRINMYYPVGELIDLIPQKRGKSKRVVELLVKGSEAQAVIKGLRIRRVLGLKETLFVLEKEYSKAGDLTHFIFTGRGWGHGVGLCQVGAFGMARAGANYKDILKKYYHGIKIAKIY
jgi:stage II sporulation protein D